MTDYIDTALSLPKLTLPVAPACVTIGALSRAPHISSLASVPFSESGGQGRFRKEIVWDRVANDYLMLLGGEPVGYAHTQSDADTTLDELIFAVRYQDTPGTDCPSCGDLLCEDAAICTACRENGEETMIDTSDTPSPNDAPIPDVDGEPPSTPQTGGRMESAGRGIARLMRHDRARFLRCVARVGDSDRRAMAGALEFYLTKQQHLFTGAPRAERILAFWASEQAVSDS